MQPKTQRTRACVICGNVFTLPTHGGQPITCSPDCQRKRRNKMVAWWREAHECPPDKHGTLTGYVNYQCDCDLCREAEKLYMRKRRRNKKNLATARGALTTKDRMPSP
jgi:hypothetical protein